MNIAVIQDEKDFSILKNIIVPETIFFAWHPQAVDACIKRKLSFKTLDEISGNSKPRAKNIFTKNITNLFAHLDKEVRKAHNLNHSTNFFTNLGVNSRKVLFAYFNEAEKLEYIKKFYKKNNIFFVQYDEEITNPLSFLLKKNQQNIRIIKFKKKIQNKFFSSADSLVFATKKKIINNLIIKKIKFFIKDLIFNRKMLFNYFYYLFNKNKKLFFVGVYDNENKGIIDLIGRRFGLSPFYLDWILRDLPGSKRVNLKFDIKKITTKILKINDFSSSTNVNLKIAIAQILKKIFEDNFFLYHLVYKKFTTLNKKANFKLGYSKYVNTPYQSLCFDQLNNIVPLFGMFHGGGSYLYEQAPIIDLNFTSRKTIINRFFDNVYAKTWAQKQNKLINKIKTRIFVIGSTYFAYTNTFKNDFISLNSKKKYYCYFLNNLGLPVGSDNKWGIHDDASYYKFLHELVYFCSSKKILLKLKLRKSLEEYNLKLFFNISKNFFYNITILKPSKIKILKIRSDIFLSSHYSTHMHELISSNKKIIFFCKKINQKVNNVFFKNLKSVVTIEDVKSRFFNKILNYDRGLSKSQLIRKKFISNFITKDTSKINIEDNILKIINKFL
tara:strand:- start:1035 stop:2867 length:1833 start_codon:yes stop_codon:yes gene_type:complete